MCKYHVASQLSFQLLSQCKDLVTCSCSSITTCEPLTNVFKYKNVNFIEAVITGLDLGTVYRVSVAGVNAIGTGLYCCGSIIVTVKTYNSKFH